MKSEARFRSGLSLVEVLLVMAAVMTMGAVLLLPALAPSRGCRAPASRISCVNNLKQVGLAYRLFANDHADLFPFALSNQLGAEDRQKLRAASFMAPLSNSNLSYFVGLDAREDQPYTILSGDRNITGGTLSNGFMRLLKPDSSPSWAVGIHKDGGNIGHGDGSVQQVADVGLVRAVQAQPNAVIRLAMP